VIKLAIAIEDHSTVAGQAWWRRSR